MKKPIVWSIAGIDPTGLAGSFVDLETLKHFSVEACGLITATTAPHGALTRLESVTAEQLEAQWAGLSRSFYPNAIKIGMLGEFASYKKIVNFLKDYSGQVVFDPVMSSSSGSSLLFGDIKNYQENVTRLFPYIDVLTPNRLEAEMLLNRSINSYDEVVKAASDLLALGIKSVLIKGGHAEDSVFSQDYWSNGQESFWLSHRRYLAKQYRGTGCVLSSAIAACLALGYGLKDALVIARMYVNRAIRQAVDVDSSSARIAHGGWPEEQEDLPYLCMTPIKKSPLSFKPCPQIGLYPVVDSSLWLEKLLPQGLRCIQLRIKDKPQKTVAYEIQKSVSLAKKYQASLFINDHWELAIQYAADGVHLGQEDMQRADIQAIYQSGLYLGISTHCYYEVARAHALHPSYMACGPIYPTASKKMAFEPQGIQQLSRWRRTLHYPLVAIGGINYERLAPIYHTKVDGISLISAITQAENPAYVTQQFLQKINELSHE